MASLEIADVTVTRGSQRVLEHVNLSVNDGELMAVVGSSGSGKTSLLRAVAGLDETDAGEIAIGGVVQRSRTQGRNVAMVFQGNVMYPFRDVARNVAFPLEVERRPKAEIEERVHAEGRALHIDDLMARNPKELSAGHQQLVQIARAMVRKPDLFLLDEPLARLDAALRISMRGELKMVQRGYGVTTLYVTNDPVEAMSMADRIAVLDHGRIQQVDAPEEVYHHPATRHTAELMGGFSVLQVHVERAQQGAWLVHEGFRVRAWAPAIEPYVGASLELGVRPEYLEASDSPDAVVRIRVVDHHGAYRIGIGTIGSDPIHVRLPDYTIRSGSRLPVRFRQYLLFDPATGRRVSA
jgi:ABC-type sugar transport system ATPase subunit